MHIDLKLCVPKKNYASMMQGRGQTRTLGTDEIRRIQLETDADEVMTKLKEMIMTDWPEIKKTLAILTPYHSFVDEMIVQEWRSIQRG